MTGDTGTRELADGRPGYRLVRREDIALADALPGRSSGLTTCRLVDGTLGSTHMALTLVSLVDGHVDEHVHSFETSFYVLEGEPVLYLDGRGVKLKPGACGAIPVGTPHAFRTNDSGRWVEMASPRPRVDASDTFFLGSAPDAPADALDARDPRNHNLFLLTEGETDLDRLKHAQAMGAPTVSGSMATAVLAYSGIAVKMLVDQRLDAQLHTMFMVDYQPGACANPHDHPFEESYYMLEGEVDVVADGDRYTLRPGDVFWTGTGCVHAFYETQGRPVRWLETSAPGPPPRHSYRHAAGLGVPRGASRLRSRSRCAMSRVSDQPATGVLDDLDLYARIYRQMLLIRGFEELVQSLFLAGEVYGTTHLYSGQEAIATGVASVLEERDRVAATYRGHGHALALGVDPQALLDEMLGRASGVNGGRAGSMNVNSPGDRMIGSFGIVGGSIAAATGAALALKRTTGGVAVAYFGDGAMNQGYVFECLNFCQVLELPLVLVCENNGYGEYTPFRSVTAGEIRARAEVMNVPAETIDGMSVWTVREAAERAIAHARSGHGPVFIEALTYRFVGHSRSDPGAYRPDGELEQWRLRDPIVVLRAKLEAEGFDATGLDALEQEVTVELERMRESGLAAPFPSELTAREFKE